MPNNSKYLIGKKSYFGAQTDNRYETFAKGISAAINAVASTDDRSFIPKFNSADVTTSTTTTTTTQLPFAAAGALGITDGVPYESSEIACGYLASITNSNFYTPGGIPINTGVQLSQGEVYVPFDQGWYVYTYLDGEPIDPRQVFYLDENSTVTTLIVCSPITTSTTTTTTTI